MWENRFSASQDYLYGKAPTQFILNYQYYLTQGSTALSVADGEGRNAVFMARQGMQVTALEIAPTAIERARALAAEQGVTVDFRQFDIMTRPWPDQQFDLVAGIFIQFIGPEGRALQFDRMKAATRPGGLILLHGYRPEQIADGTGGPPSAANMYTADILRDAFRDWDILVLKEYDREIQEGAGHAGMSALIDLVVRKPV